MGTIGALLSKIQCGNHFHGYPFLASDASLSYKERATRSFFISIFVLYGAWGYKSPAVPSSTRAHDLRL